MRIVAVDPGKMSGFCEVNIGTCNPVVLYVAQFGLDELGSLSANCDPVDVLIIEDFILRTGSSPGGKWDSGLSPVHVTGYIMGALNLLPSEVVRQQASEAKGVVTDDRLRRLGLWVPGLEHGRDAIRHAVLYCRKQGISVRDWEWNLLEK